MNRPSMHQPSDLWQRDGSLRDVYVFDAEPEDWSVLVNLAQSGEYRYSADGVLRSFPGVEGVFAEREASHLLQVQVGAASVNCHFFVPSEIELDIDPREVVDEFTHEAVLSFLESLACGIRKVVALTAENAPESPLLTFDPVSMQWSIHAPAFEQRGV
jgi:hypothetical protein